MTIIHDISKPVWLKPEVRFFEEMSDLGPAATRGSAGELLKQIEPAPNHHGNSTRDATGPSSRKEAGAEAGMSGRQVKTAIRFVSQQEAAGGDAAKKGRDGKWGVGAQLPLTSTEIAREISRRVGVSPQTVGNWRSRLAERKSA